MTILVTGSRNWTNGRCIMARLAEEPDGTQIIEGGAPGADTLARHAAMALGFKVTTVRADWTLGKKAGPIRNREMLNWKPDRVIAFHPDLSRSRGTKDCVEEARRRGIPVEIIRD